MNGTFVRFPLTVALLGTLAVGVVTSVAAGGDAAPAGAAPQLACGESAVVSRAWDYLPTFSGHPSPARALADLSVLAVPELVSWFVTVEDASAEVRYAARVDGRLVAIAMVGRGSEGGWHVDELLVCANLLRTVPAAVTS